MSIVRSHLRAIVAALCLLFALSARAIGSFQVGIEFEPIRKQIPELWRALSESLELQQSGWANRIGKDVNPRLGGMRLGPYCVLGKPKGASGPYTLKVCFNTEYLWFDAAGNKSTLEEATRVEERFVSVDIEPWRDK
jgi:hypothetical protein